ncbi:MAG: hypothetical protein US73_C0012G0040 [Candidatus Falkowbacteria bacterium GW2011_GWF2_38_1205]|nr:MAG: hypothetical protein US73_C0012G0040 [Candidatus Falkowbacteria bacterium GW2011_GWF2_38_1205]
MSAAVFSRILPDIHLSMIYPSLHHCRSAPTGKMFLPFTTVTLPASTSTVSSPAKPLALSVPKPCRKRIILSALVLAHLLQAQMSRSMPASSMTCAFITAPLVNPKLRHLIIGRRGRHIILKWMRIRGVFYIMLPELPLILPALLALGRGGRLIRGWGWMELALAL